jgi:predicted CxxxxCH...CXXCH cytochrome family protein
MIFSNPKAFTTRLLSALAFAAAGVAGTSGIAEAATCITCHAPTGSTTDIRPVEFTYRNITTGSIKGSHAKHIPTPTLSAATCNPCHGSAAAGYITSHRNGLIEVPGVGYSKSVSFPQSGNPILGTCNAASCHDNGKGVLITTATWGTAVPACTACHALVPGDSHAQHVTGTLYKKAVCADCHTGYVQGTTAAANHLNGTVEVNTGGYSSPKAKGSAFGTCATSYCHSSGQSANGATATPVYAPVAWGGTVVCGSCHATTAPNIATGSHTNHLNLDTNCGNCHTGATATSYPSASHVNGVIDVGVGSYTAAGAPGNGYGTCSTAVCHGSSSPVWGANTTNNVCTKCHGTGTVTVTAANRNVVAPSDPAATDTGKVSANVKTGAHQTHLLMLNGLSAVGTIDERCQNCHGTLPVSGSHANGSSTPVFQGLATKNGAMTASYTGTNCTNTYCHNPAGTGGTLNAANAGTGITPSWTNAGYIADGTLKTLANCGTCHKVPGIAGFTSTTDHSAAAMPLGINTDCSGCHGHNGDITGIAGQQHMDGIKYGGGNCDSCHDYDTVGATYAAGSWTGGTWGKNSKDGLTPNEGFGAHNKHINYIKSRLGIAVALTATNQTFGSGQPASVCGTCHTNLPANHTTSGSTVRAINFGDSAFTMGGTSLLFGATNPVYNGASGTSSATTAKTCSNLSCHYFTTPLWSTY